MNKGKRHITNLGVLMLVLIALNVLSGFYYIRFDLTQDNRYTLSNASIETIEMVDSPILIHVFLEGTFPPEFRKLQSETKQLLEEFTSYNSHITYEFLNPLEDEVDRQVVQQQLANFGLTAAQIEIKENGKITNELVYPWALAYYNGKTVKIPLLKNQLGTTTEERVNNSIQNLEYSFSDGFKKLASQKSKKVAVLKGNGELDDRYIADFFKTLRDYYFIAPFTLDSAATNPKRTLEQIITFDLLVIAKPTESFNDTEKYILDQYTMNGGRSLWLVDAVEIQEDTTSGKKFAFSKDIGLNDFFFKYGIRINPNLIKDVYSAPIVLASGSENDTQFNRYPWFYSPLSASSNNHPIITNIEAVKFDYVSAIDTLPNTINKTVLLTSSAISKLVGLPAPIDFDIEIPKNIAVINNGPDPNEFSAGELPIAVLLEGKFSSVYTNRIKPFKISDDQLIGQPTKMVVISDGDLIMNQFDRNRPLELGFDKMTSALYGNKEFLLNTVNFLLDDSGLINIRSKEITMPFLDQEKTVKERLQWQVINLILPLGLLLLFGIAFNYFRKRKYAY